jgi:hypothetical protein
MDDIRDWRMAFDPRNNPTGIVISQNLRLEDEAHVRWQVGIIRRFYNTQRATIPSLLVIDEGMDFFGPTGNSLHGNIVQRCWRAGGERGMSCLMNVQRPKTINIQMLTESNLLYLFHLAYRADVKRLVEMGLPEGTEAPAEEDYYRFKFMKHGHLYPKMLRLSVE